MLYSYKNYKFYINYTINRATKQYVEGCDKTFVYYNIILPHYFPHIDEIVCDMLQFTSKYR